MLLTLQCASPILGICFPGFSWCFHAGACPTWQQIAALSSLCRVFASLCPFWCLPQSLFCGKEWCIVDLGVSWPSPCAVCGVGGSWLFFSALLEHFVWPSDTVFCHTYLWIKIWSYICCFVGNIGQKVSGKQQDILILALKTKHSGFISTKYYFLSLIMWHLLIFTVCSKNETNTEKQQQRTNSTGKWEKRSVL